MQNPAQRSQSHSSSPTKLSSIIYMALATTQSGNSVQSQLHYFLPPSIMTDPRPIFCCEKAHVRKENKPYKDTYTECHIALFQSFLAFAERRQRARSLINLIRGADSKGPAPLLSNASLSSPPRAPQPVLTPEALENNPITPDTPYIIHLSTRHDFGPVVSHRYFVCPSNLEHDWREATLVQWFANGEPFKLKINKWDIKCLQDAMFYRLVLRPNLALRTMPQVTETPKCLT